MYAEVIVPLPLEGTFTYAVPEPLAAQVQVGVRVMVPFGRSKRYAGIVAELRTEAEALPQGAKGIKDIQEVLDEQPAVRPEQLRFWRWLASYYMCSLGEVYKAAMPAGMKLSGENGFRARREVRVRLCAEHTASTEALDALLDNLKRTPKRLHLAQCYIELSGLRAALALDNPGLVAEVSRQALLEESGASAAVLLAMRSKGVMETYEVEVSRLKTAVGAVAEQMPLSEAQAQAYDTINRSHEKQTVCLLHGVTSSGKTEVYIRLIRDVLARGGQVLYLVPEIALTTQLAGRLRAVFGGELGVYHSKFPDAERVEVWHKQLSDQPYGVMLGARSSLLLPFRNLQLVIVDEEHEPSYKQQDPAPRYHARDAAIVLATMLGAKVLLGTATPSLESYHNALTGKYGLAELAARYGDVQMPEVEVADVRELQRTKQMEHPFSPRLKEELGRALASGEQAILFQNRRGYAPVTSCSHCAWTPKCERCDVALTYHQRLNKLVCHYCGATYDLPTSCPQCGGTDFHDLGYGTEKVEEAVHRHFPTARTARLDLDEASTRAAFERVLGDFAAGRTDILIGTQMVSKGLDFDRVRVVGIMNADIMLGQPDFRAFERTYQMLSQVAGRAGRRQRRGLVILQTRKADYPLIRQVCTNDYRAMFDDQMAEREAFGFPPFVRLINLTLKHRDARIVSQAADTLALLLRSQVTPDVLGPNRPHVARVQLLYIRQITVRIDAKAPAAPVRQRILQAVRSLQQNKAYASIQVTYDVDPV